MTTAFLSYAFQSDLLIYFNFSFTYCYSVVCPTMSCRSAWVGRPSPSICLSVYLSVA